MRGCDVIQIRASPSSLLQTPSLQLKHSESATLAPAAVAARKWAQPAIFLNPRAAVPDRLVRGALWARGP